jgi:glycosyl transferase family 2
MMPLYNAERYVREAIGSVLAQTYTDFELLVRDDGSTDGSAAAVAEFAQDPRVRFTRNDRNRGVSWSRQAVLEDARGDYIAVLDADDVAFPHRLARQVAFLDAHPDIAVLGSAFEVIDRDGVVRQQVRVPVRPEVIRWMLLFGSCIAHSSVMYRREAVLRGGGYRADMLVSEDYDLWVRLAGTNRIAQLDDVLVRWRHHGANTHLTEREEVRHAGVAGVRQSVRVQTGLDIAEPIAECLARDVSPRSVARGDAEAAVWVLARCAAEALSRARRDGTDTGAVAAAVAADYLRLAYRVPSVRTRATLGAVRTLTAAGAWRAPWRRDFAVLALKAWLPRRLAEAARRRALRGTLWELGEEE